MDKVKDKKKMTSQLGRFHTYIYDAKSRNFYNSCQVWKMYHKQASFEEEKELNFLVFVMIIQSQKKKT
jgi:hypothetical protein